MEDKRRGPIKFTEAKRKKFLALLAEGLRRGEALKAVGCGRSILSDYTIYDPAFKELMDESELAASEHIESALWQKAMSGNVPSMIFWLCNRASSRWQDKRQYSTTLTTTAPYNPENQAAVLRDPAQLKQALNELPQPPGPGPA